MASLLDFLNAGGGGLLGNFGGRFPEPEPMDELQRIRQQMYGSAGRSPAPGGTALTGAPPMAPFQQGPAYLGSDPFNFVMQQGQQQQQPNAGGSPDGAPQAPGTPPPAWLSPNGLSPVAGSAPAPAPAAPMGGMPVSLASPPASLAPPASAIAPQAAQPSFGSRVNDFLANNPATLMALGGGIARHGIGGGFLDAAPFAMKESEQGRVARSQMATYQALSKLMPEPMARAATLNPDLLKTIAPEYFGGFKLVKTGSNPITGDQFMMQGPGGKLHSLESFAADRGGIGGSSSLGGGSGMLAAGVKNYDPNLSGDEYLAQFSPEVQAAVKARLNGDQMPTGNPRTQGIVTGSIPIAQKYAQDKGIPYSDALYAQKRKMQVDLASSSPNSMGGILSNGKSAFGHLANLSDKMVDLGNQNGPNIPGGGHIGTLGNWTGNVVAPTAETKGKIVGVNDNALKYGQEATKFYAGTGGGEAERMNALKTAKAETATGMEQASFLQTEKELMLERLHQKEAQVRDTLGQDYLDRNPVRTPDLEKAIKKIDANIARLRGEVAPIAKSLSPGWTVKRVP